VGPNLFSHDHTSRKVEVTITIHLLRTGGTRGQDLRPVHQIYLCSRSNVVGRLVETILWARRPGYRIPAEARNFSLLQKSRPPLRPTQTHMPWLPGLFLGGNMAGTSCYNRSPSSSADVMKKWIYASAPPYAVMV